MGLGGYLGLCSLALNFLPLIGLPGWASVNKDVLSLSGITCPSVGWYPRELFPFSEEKRREQLEEGFF